MVNSQLKIHVTEWLFLLEKSKTVLQGSSVWVFPGIFLLEPGAGAEFR